MLDLSGYIHALLLEHDCVSIPGFGGMVAQRFRAEINPGTNIMRPPSKRISYHKELVANSHLLLQKVAADFGYNQSKASEQIAAAVTAWKTELISGNSVKVAAVGRFYLEKDGTINFNQSLESNFDLDAFGLDIFRATAIKRDAAIKESVTVAIAESVKKTNTLFPYWRAAAVFAGIGALLTIGFFKTDYTIPERLTANFNPLHYSRAIEVAAPNQPEKLVRVEDNFASAYEEKRAAELQEISAPVEETKIEETKAEPIATFKQPAETNSFFVIVGSFKESANANDLVASLTAQGYPAQVVGDNSGYAKVSIEGFSSRVEAVQAMRAYQLSVSKSAWIYNH